MLKPSGLHSIAIAVFTVFFMTACSSESKKGTERTEVQTDESIETPDVKVVKMSDEQVAIFNEILSSLQDSSLLLYQTKQSDLPSIFFQYEDESEYDGHSYSLKNGDIEVKYKFFTKEDSTLASIDISAWFPNHESMKANYDELRGNYENSLGEAKMTRDDENEKSYFKKWKIGDDNLFFQTDRGASNFLFRYTRY